MKPLGLLTRTALTAVGIVACAPGMGCGPGPGELRGIPRPEMVRLWTGESVRAGRLELEAPDTLTARFGAAVDTIRARLRRTGVSGESIPVRIEIRDIAPDSTSESATPWAADTSASRALSHREGFLIQVRRDEIRVAARSPLGAIHGLTTLERAVRSNSGRLPAGLVADWPDHETRALHFVLRDVEVEAARRLVGLAREHRFNTLIVQLADGVELPSLPASARRDAWSANQLAEFVDYARAHGLRVVPEVKLLSGQHKLFKGHRQELMYNSRTYDPRAEGTYRLVRRVLEDVVRIVRPEAVHIGHDDVAGVGPGERAEQQLPPGEEPLPASLFLADVRRVHAILQELGVETWMWGDMLIGPSEFPGMLGRHMHGTSAYTDLRGRLPDGIVICDWHYADRQADFPSTRAFLEAGHPVLGATWRRPATTESFSRYAAGLGQPGMRGMIATTWWLVQRGRWKDVAAVAEFSGTAFWNADVRRSPEEGS